jgi:hypothetical protein
MRDLRNLAGKLEVLKREPSSKNGNPRYLLLIDGQPCVTSPDSSLAYSITNYHGKNVQATIGTHYGRATLDTVKLS